MSTATFVDHYLALGLPTGEEGVRLTEAQITKAFKARALEVHPDKRPRAEVFQAHADFKKLNDSYHVLMDVQAQFDAFLLNRRLGPFPLRRPRRRRRARRPPPEQQQQEHHHCPQRGGSQENRAAGVKRRNMADFEKQDWNWKRRRTAEVTEDCKIYAKMMQEISGVLKRKLNKTAAALKDKPIANRGRGRVRGRGRGRAKGDNNNHNNMPRVARITYQKPRKSPAGGVGVRIAQVAFRGIKKVAQLQMPVEDGVKVQTPSSSLDRPMADAERLPELFDRLQIQPIQV